jgi:serine O-acetyltransferase
MVSAELADDMSFSELVFSDLQRYRPDERGWLRVIARCVMLPGMIGSIIVRGQQCLSRSGYGKLAMALRNVGIFILGADFSPGMKIGPGFMLVHPTGVTIGFNLTIGSNVTFAGGVVAASRYPDPREQELATICDDAIIGAHAVMVGPVRIGRNAMVGANAVVLSDVPENAVVFGSPARQISVREALTG